MHDIAHLWQADDRGVLTSEDGFLDLVDSFFPASSPHFPRGRGHDCAELAGLPGSLALSTDMFLQGSHFSPAYFTPEEAGAKALTVAVSDLAAAGARPLGFSLGLILPEGMPVRTVEGVLRGMAGRAAEYEIVLTGGDVARGAGLGFSLCVWGENRHGEKGFLRRGGAVPGDCVFMIGRAGLARVGLHFLESAGREAIQSWPEATAAHLAPKALLDEGGKLAALAFALDASAERGSARISLMDVSDGLARDLPRLLAGAGAELDLSRLAMPDEVGRAASYLGMDAEDVFLAGGEDYALAGTCPEEVWPRLQAALPGARLLGRVTADRSIARRDGRPMPGGFDHFEKDTRGKGVPARTDIADARRKGKLRKQTAEAVAAMIRLGGQAHAAGLMAGFNGNISCRIRAGEDGGEYCAVTRSGAAKGRLEPGDFILLSLPDGQAVSGCLPPSPAGPSSESPLHLAVYAACPDSDVILHVHPPKLLALSLLVGEQDLLRLPLPEAERYRAALAWTPFHPPGGEELARVVGEAAKTHPAVWMQRHGLVVHGRDMTGALALCEELEQLAGVQIRLASFGIRKTG